LNIAITPNASCAPVGSSEQLAAVVTMQDGRSFPLVGGVWRTPDSLNLFVDSSGVVSAVKPGYGIVSATIGNISGTGEVFVTQGLVTFVIDDAHAEDYTIKKPIFDKHGLVGVLAVPTRVRWLTNAQLLEFQNSGWEIAGHSRTHINEVGLSESQLEDEIEGSKLDLQAIGMRVESYVYPYGAHDSLVDLVTAKYYRSGVTASGGANPEPLQNWYSVRRVNFGATFLQPGQVNTLEYYESLVNDAKQSGHWLIFMIHEVGSADAQILDGLLSFIKDQAVPVVTLSDGLDRFEPNSTTPTILRACSS
jgi:peptidoglycan/xylan/chitin deacetylase (PgdA/CDA1 family)